MKVSFRAALMGLVGLTSQAEAQPFAQETLINSGRYRGMGGAMVAVPDDEASLWVNPAGLAGLTDASLQVFPFRFEASDDLIPVIMDGMNTAPELSFSAFNRIQGRKISLRTQLTPSFVMPHFAMSWITDIQFASFARNASLPQIRFGHQVTNGVQVGYAYAWEQGGHRRGRKNSKDPSQRIGSEFRAGAAAKLLWRRGGYFDLGPLEIYRLEEGAELLKDILGGYGMGIGLDLGLQWMKRFHPGVELTLGAAFTDIGGTKFSDPKSTPIPGNFTVGSALKLSANSSTHFLLSADYRNFFQGFDWRKKFSMGLEMSLPVVKIYANFHQSYFGYGAGFNLGIVSFQAITFLEEMGPLVGDAAQRRYTLAVNLKLPL